MKNRVVKLVRQVLISGAILIALIFAAGFGYTWYMERQAPANVATPVTTTADAYAPPIQHVEPAANAKFGISVQILTTPVNPGEIATMSVRTRPGATCTITAVYNNVPSKDASLTPKVADTFGGASWDFTVDSTAPIGKWPITVTCKYGQQSIVAIGTLEVKKS